MTDDDNPTDPVLTPGERLSILKAQIRKEARVEVAAELVVAASRELLGPRGEDGARALGEFAASLRAENGHATNKRRPGPGSSGSGGTDRLH